MGATYFPAAVVLAAKKSSSMKIFICAGLFSRIRSRVSSYLRVTLQPFISILSSYHLFGGLKNATFSGLRCMRMVRWKESNSNLSVESIIPKLNLVWKTCPSKGSRIDRFFFGQSTVVSRPINLFD